MGKNSNQLYDDLYVGDYDYEEKIEPIVANKAAKKLKQSQQRAEKLAKRQEQSLNKEQRQSTEKSIENWEPITDKPVECRCNKCGTVVSAKMLAFFYSPNSEMYFPFVEYSCRQCYHTGRRSVYSAALPLDKFEKRYFG